jgi:hypothetical protein
MILTPRVTLPVLLALAGCGAEEGGAGGGSGDVAFVVRVSPEPPRVGPAGVEVALSKGDAPITGADLRIEGNMSHAGMVPVFADAEETAPGTYAADLELTMAGDWFLVVTAELPDGRTFEETHQLPGVRRD